jgi:DNA-binding NtrC family response regulator
MDMDKILIVDDDEDIRETLGEVLERQDYAVVEAADGREALDIFGKGGLSAVLLDMKLPDIDGLEILKQMKCANAAVPVIIITGLGDIQNAIDSIKLGAYDYIVKPAKIDRLTLTLKHAIEKFRIEGSFRELVAAVDTQIGSYFGKSEAIRRVVEQIRPVAASDFTVIIQGETGSGKNYFARVLHNMSKRVNGPFVSIDMGAIPDSLVESELFGYEKGAFTGAEKSKKGLLELANGGTVLIDELQNMSPLVQAKLLKVTDEKKFYPLGSTRSVEADVRIISCTNADIRKEVHEKKFREDLYFRLGEFIIFLPPLRERTEDIAVLARHFFTEVAEELNKPVREISDEAMELFVRYEWPGNVRELRNIIRRAVLLSNDGVLRPEHIQFNDARSSETCSDIPLLPLKEVSALVVREAEQKALRQAMILTKGNKSQAAKLLKVDYKTLLTKLKDYKISE